MDEGRDLESERNKEDLRKEDILFTWRRKMLTHTIQMYGYEAEGRKLC
jgi:hypothetical protein